jgi:antitoxin (DNA-binding transcriptional repressor) of toxin-antitoxin stability system
MISRHENTSKQKKIGVSAFKAKALALFTRVSEKGESFTITKKDKPVALVIPCSAKKPASQITNSLKGLATIQGDIVHCDWSDDWEAAGK